MSWRTVQLDAVALLDRQSVDPSDIDANTPYLGLEHLDSEGGIERVETIQSAAPRSNKLRFSDQHVLFGKLRPYLRKTARPGFSGVCSTDIIPILPSDQLSRDYLFYFLRTPEVVGLATSRCSGANLPRLSPKQLASFTVPLPPLPEQKRIAGILDAADALRAKRRESLAQLDTLLQSTFLDMFGDPVTNPMGWEEATLGEVIKVKSGNGLVKKDMAPDGEFPVYGGNGINGYHDAYMFEEPKVILGRVGVYCGVVHLTEPRAWVTDNALYVHEFLRPVDTTYLLAALTAANLNQYANQAAQPLISGGRIYPVRIALPPQDLQHRFATIVQSIEQQKALLQAHLTQLDTLFACLQSRAFRGEL
jgi:type I restriction enzyme, S subunit